MIKKYSLATLSILTLSLIGCSAMGNSSDAPAPMQAKLLVDQVTSGTTMNLTAMLPMDVPNATTPKVSNSTIFRVSGNVIGDPNSISWQGLFADYRALELHKGYLGIAQRIPPSNCNPKTGVQTGQTITVTFN